MDADALVIRGDLGQRVAVAVAASLGVFLTYALAMIGLNELARAITGDPLVPVWLVWLGLVVALSVWWWRALRRRAELTPDGIVLRSFVRTDVIEWCHVESIDTVQSEDEWTTFHHIRLWCHDSKRARKLPGRWSSIVVANAHVDSVRAARARYA
jgi:hypothetical protein